MSKELRELWGPGEMCDSDRFVHAIPWGLWGAGRVKTGARRIKGVCCGDRVEDLQYVWLRE